MASHDKVALVTGAGSGIGRAAALALQGAGFAVVLAGRRAGPLAETAKSGAPDGPQMLAIPTDVADPASVRALFANTKEVFGRLDLLFNNAGTNAPKALLEDLAVKDWKAVVDVNLTGAFLCAQEAIKIMKAQEPRGGRIINNGSIAAHSPRPDSVAYATTKHAISGLTKCISLDGRKYDIACGQIDIGNADTDLVRGMTQNAAKTVDGADANPVMDVAHCGAAVAYMAGLPLDANVQTMTIMATKMPYIGRG